VNIPPERVWGTSAPTAIPGNGANARLANFPYATGGVVLSTVRHAADLDHRLMVMEECGADQAPEVHDFLTQRIFPRQTTVVSADDVIQTLSA
jgi:hypothetical protein